MTAKTPVHFLLAARQCEIGELEQLMRTSALVQRLGALIHGLQTERGLSNLVLATRGARAVQARLEQVAQCEAAEAEVRAAFDALDTGPQGGHGARLFSRIAYVLQGLDALRGLRTRIAALEIDPATATAAFVQLVAGLLAVVFEAADSASDPEVSRALVAMFNFMQGKEFAGQERAAGAAAFGAGDSDAQRQQHWLHLIESQERCFQVFAELAPAGPLALWQAIRTDNEVTAELERLRRIACTTPAGAALDAGLSQPWFDTCTRRMDAMHQVEARLSDELLALCRRKVAEARASLAEQQDWHGAPEAERGGAAFFDGIDPQAANVADYGPHVRRSVLDLVREQSHRLQAMRDELDAVRSSLNERKLVERAKGLLMAHRHLSESAAHRMLRETAMNQNRRLVDVAQAVLAMADLLAPSPEGA